MFVAIFRANIINTIAPSFLTFADLNIPMVLEGCWNLICVVSGRKLKPQTSPAILMMLAFGGLLAP